MSFYQEKIKVPFSSMQMYNLICDVESYPEFIPWIEDAAVYQKINNNFNADLKIGFNHFKLSYSSAVTCVPYESITVQSTNGPLQNLENRWKFTDISDTECEIDFLISFQFKSFLFQGMMDNALHSAITKITDAFQKRAKQIYL